MGRPKKEETFNMAETPEKLPKDYAIIKIMAKLSKNDTDIVVTNVNGDRRRWMRNKWVVMPNSHVESLRHAIKPVASPATIADINPFTDHAVKEVKEMPRFAFEVRGYVDKTIYEKLRKIILPTDKGGQGRELNEQEIMTALQ